MKLATAVLLASTSAIASPKPAAPPAPIEVSMNDIDAATILDPLPWSNDEPGGVKIPVNAARGWTAMGLHPGDVIVREDGHPVHGTPTVGEGALTLDVMRDGKILELRYVIRGDAKRKATLNDGVLHDLARQTDPVATEATVRGTPSGVRVISTMIWFELITGDIVRTVDGVPVQTNAQFVVALTSLKVGQTEVLVDREGKRLSLVLEREPPPDVSRIARADATHFTVPHDVLQAIAHDPDLIMKAAQFAHDANKLVVAAVDAGSLLERAGFAVGDEITDIGDKPITAFDGDFGIELFGAWVHLHNASTFAIKIKRKNQVVTLTYTVAPA